MPAQQLQGQAVYYVELDTAPALEAVLLDGDDNPIDLTNRRVFISIAFAMPRGSYYTSPRDQIVSYDEAIVDPDQINNTGAVSWWPGDDLGVNALTPPGQFLYQWTITWDDAGTARSQTIPPNTYLPMTIETRVGGRAYNPPTP